MIDPIQDHHQIPTTGVGIIRRSRSTEREGIAQEILDLDPEIEMMTDVENAATPKTVTEDAKNDSTPDTSQNQIQFQFQFTVPNYLNSQINILQLCQLYSTFYQYLYIRSQIPKYTKPRRSHNVVSTTSAAFNPLRGKQLSY